MSLRGFVETFPPLKVALYVNDVICYVFSSLLKLVYFVLKQSFRLIVYLVKLLAGPLCRLLGRACSKLYELWNALPAVRRFREERDRHKYERLKGQKDKAASGLDDSREPYYENQLVKRAITYHGGLILALGMYIFVYFVLIKHHTYLSVSLAFLFLLIYLLIIESSHNIRSILMLCLPIMFTNRGRALVFCSMLALLAGGPITTMHHNVREIHTSLNCCKQYLIVHTDEYVGDNVVNKLVKMEEVVVNLVNEIKVFANNLKHKFDGIIQMAIDLELFVEGTIRKLKDALNFCQHHSGDLQSNCAKTLNNIFVQCNALAGRIGLCTMFGKLKDVCKPNNSLPGVLCELPRYVIDFFARTVGQKLAEYVQLIENEFYVDVDVKRRYAYNMTKSKPYSEMIREIKFDVEQKFWYVRIVRRVFNFVSLILVTWILLTATIYHMHYLRELSYDNMYLDERLDELAFPDKLDLAPEHERLYLRPFSLRMNKFEMSKLYVSGLVWLVIVGYISFFVALDYSLFQLVDFLVTTLREILFTSDLPLIDLKTKSRRTNNGTEVEKVVTYNRTYLSALRKRLKTHSLGNASTKTINSTTEIATNGAGTKTYLHTTNGTDIGGGAPSDEMMSGAAASSSSIQAFYDRLMASIESDIPDDVAILDSLEGCLPKVEVPVYDVYRALLYLALFTFAAVIVEAYALRTRHCIANLYYPRRARRRAKWLFRKLMAEKPKFEQMHEDE
jgi:hypothetical protein